jgi:hypothetical protein
VEVGAEANLLGSNRGRGVLLDAIPDNRGRRAEPGDGELLLGALLPRRPEEHVRRRGAGLGWKLPPHRGPSSASWVI